jgi:opacity protein-like surface antigen
MRKVKIHVGIFIGVMLSSTAYCGTEEQVPVTPAPAGYYDAPTLKMTADIRQYAVGTSIGVFGGINFAQNGNVDISSSALPGFNTSVSEKNQLGGVAGFKVGYTWPGWDKWNDSNDKPITSVNGDFAVLPSIDYEFFWTGYKFKGQGTYDGIGTQLTAALNAYVFSLDPTIKFQIGMFRPYIGAGIGGAYITADHGVASASGIGSANLVGSSDDFCFAVQGLAGVEMFVAKNWTLSLDYKYLDFIDPTFGGGAGQSGFIPLHYHSDSIGNNIVTAGVNYYF